MHCLIVGAPGVGKSTLIRRVLQELNRPIGGFLTKKEKGIFHPILGNPIYIYAVGEEEKQCEENLIGYCKDRRPVVYKEGFDRFAPHLVEPVPQDGIVVMDEIGFMESASEAFCQGVLGLLDGEVPVLAGVKDKDTPFLTKVRTHPKATCFYLTEENRDRVFLEVLEYMNDEKIMGIY